jgi:hypothetical protein
MHNNLAIFVYCDTMVFPVDFRMIKKSEERHKLDGGIARNQQWSLGEDLEAPAAFPAGMLGIHFPTDTPAMINEIGRALSVFAHGLNSLYLDR